MISYLNALQLLPYSQIICNYLLDLALSLCFLWFGQCNSAFVLFYLMKDFQVSLSIQSTRAERTSVSCTPGYFYLKASICKGSATLGSREKCAHSVFYFWINVGLGGGKAGGGASQTHTCTLFTKVDHTGFSGHRISLNSTVWHVYIPTEQRPGERTDNIEPQWWMCSCGQAVPVSLTHTHTHIRSMDTLPSTGTCLHFLIPPTDIHKCTRSVNAGWNDVASHTRTYKGKKVNDYLCTDRKVNLKCLREHQMELCPPVAINCCFQGNKWRTP